MSTAEYDGSKIPLTDEEIDRQEMKDNQELTSQKTKLEALQKQKPPTDP